MVYQTKLERDVAEIEKNAARTKFLVANNNPQDYEDYKDCSPPINLQSSESSTKPLPVVNPIVPLFGSNYPNGSYLHKPPKSLCTST